MPIKSKDDKVSQVEMLAHLSNLLIPHKVCFIYFSVGPNTEVIFLSQSCDELYISGPRQFLEKVFIILPCSTVSAGLAGPSPDPDRYIR